MNLYDDAEVIFTEDKAGNRSSFDQLPYLFRDPHRMDKKVDVKKLQFGSKIDRSGAKREELFRVKKVIAPDKNRTQQRPHGPFAGDQAQAVVPGRSDPFPGREVSKSKSVFEI